MSLNVPFILSHSWLDFFKVWFCYHQWNGPTNHYLLLLHFYSDSCSKFVTNTINIICIWVLHILPKAHWISSKCTASIRTINNRTTVLWSYFPPPTISFAWFKSCNQIPIGKISHLWRLKSIMPMQMFGALSCEDSVKKDLIFK